MCASYELSTSELLEFLSPFGGWQTFALGVIEQIVSICMLYDNFKSNFCVLPDPGLHLAFYAVTV